MKKALRSLGLGLFVVVVALAADDPKKKDAAFDPAKLVGDWSYVSGVRAGEKVDKDHLAGTVTFTKDTITIPAGPNEKFTIAYKVDAKASPATIDMEIKDGPVKEGKATGLIEFEGDELKLVYTTEGAKRPAKLESTKENNAFLFVLKKKAK
jgi:uncharacterized protein (TIGR03067 family)